MNELIPLKPGQVRGAARSAPVQKDMTVGELREALKDFPDDLRVGFRIARHAVLFHPIRAAHLKALKQWELMHILDAEAEDERVLVLTDYDTPVIPEKKKHA